jgi:hypothetical protein
MPGDDNHIRKLKEALATARARALAAARSPVAMERLRAETEAKLALERELADAEGVEAAHLCPWDVPWSAGAPCPVVAADGSMVHVAYYADERFRPPEQLPRPAGPGEVVAIASFRRCLAHRLGPPNDEAIHGHPLYGRGLQMYAAHLVARSSWIGELERRNRVHSAHTPERYATLKHYLLCFHDETFECVAEDRSLDVVEGVPHALFSWLASRGTLGT